MPTVSFAAALEREKAMQRELAAMNLTSVAAERAGMRDEGSGSSSSDDALKNGMGRV